MCGGSARRCGRSRPRTLLTHNFGSIEWAMANRLRLVHQVHVEDGFGPEERERQLPRRVWLRRVFLRGRTVALPSQTLMRIARQSLAADPSAAALRAERDRSGPLRRAAAAASLARRRPGGRHGGGAAAGEERRPAGPRLPPRYREAPARLVLIGDGPERPALEALGRSSSACASGSTSPAMSRNRRR